MCGIVGGIAQRNVVPILLEGLRRLEYRGYDSAGLAVVNGGELHRKRELGKVQGLAALVEADPMPGLLGIAHTRWATHGKPSTANAHPHTSGDKVAVVHNGIIENYAVLKAEQLAQGYEFTSQTDTEVIVHEVFGALRTAGNLLAAVRQAVQKLSGAYALGIISADEPDVLVACRKGSPLVIGVGIGEYFIASDVAALLPVTQRFMFLEEGDIAALRIGSVEIYNADGQRVERPIRESLLSPDAVDKGAYRHYMLKEIYEQPTAIAQTLEGRFINHRLQESAFGHNAAQMFDEVKAVQILACGTSYHAGLVARYWFEELARIPCQVEVASEFRYRKPMLAADTLVVTISQSGETADTLAALQEAKKLGAKYSLTLCNVPESSLVRESDLVLMTRAGPEIGVASTKAFTTQLVTLMLLVMALGRRFQLDAALEAKITAQLFSLPQKIDKVLRLNDPIRLLSEQFAEKNNALFLGRGAHYPIAMEGALKLKEISYIHAEAYPAGELKHGPLALIDADMPVITVAPNNSLLEKLQSNMEEVSARGGQLIVFMDETLVPAVNGAVQMIKVPQVDNEISPILYTIPLQLLAYHVAVLKGTDVDQPRNLAKSVTVE
ncbi:glutamine--fructose-6-phosphate transaminase (isomerizing) [Methylovulum psychrotolerans]|jgi:glucosamine--fructose-6-phosphate aminotransferase (isomerizing)|uniref:Glutamine--fructose-6-phosphate aminotransferase [isomerizing] n=1 Tax=Methylovulum psychrotolerans TaxID=1704499 RepID=A0A1Z4BVL6_9GAMM|nr:glutamine--fructose-6-phosphate transaminase (isomerizing) [Methylovulum psychrotolerans]ASF45290.1 glutamine--fructose-6-phosphate transaminase (isomerizing) [Methylovulum psychrotolerans]MBT9096554.1 glutamine--fructose-6-phosphate transaminase (isomerizing) [Methylovulum psychrotolerans]POZ53259.1 glutamine--fructose-6-phosphate transaminase (isomerizing) [Methylovulum psychrotolerans]